MDMSFLLLVAPIAGFFGYILKKQQDYEVRISVLEANIKDIHDDIIEIKVGITKLVERKR